MLRQEKDDSMTGPAPREAEAAPAEEAGQESIPEGQPPAAAEKGAAEPLAGEALDEAGEARAPAGPTAAEGESAAGDGGAAPESQPDVASLEDRIAALEARERELSDQYVRLLAEFDNYRRRTRQEMETLRATAAERLLADVLPVIDSLDHALAAAGGDAAGPLGQGVKLIRQQLLDVLARHGLAPIEAVGQPFDPNLMEAVAEAEPGDGAPPGYVVEEYRRGYRLHDKVLRPSLVKVAAAR